MDNQFSRDALIRFLDFVGEKGLITRKNAQNWRVATGKLLDDLSAAEQEDVRKIDVDMAFRRFANRTAGKFNPQTLTQYRQRATVALQNFADFAADPESFKPRGQAAPTSGEKERKVRKASTNAHGADAVREALPDSSDGNTMVMTYPLRKDFLAQLRVPRDMTVGEARRFSAFIMTLAVDFQPDD